MYNYQNKLYFKKKYKMYEIVILACENGTYGYDCNNTCGHCTDKESCFHTNGTCRFGCNPGYIGELCKTGKFSCIVHSIALQRLTFRLFFLITKFADFFYLSAV